MKPSPKERKKEKHINKKTRLQYPNKNTNISPRKVSRYEQTKHPNSETCNCVLTKAVTNELK